MRICKLCVSPTTGTPAASFAMAKAMLVPEGKRRDSSAARAAQEHNANMAQARENARMSLDIRQSFHQVRGSTAFVSRWSRCDEYRQCACLLFIYETVR